MQSRTSRDNKLTEIYIADRVENLRYARINCVFNRARMFSIFLFVIYRTNYLSYKHQCIIYIVHKILSFYFSVTFLFLMSFY